MPKFLVFLCLLIAKESFSQDTSYLEVHFLYGSKPKKEFKASEEKWFGGILGGHVGVALDSTQILNFVPSGKLHIFAKKADPHSSFVLHSYQDFYSIFGGPTDSMKRTIVYIPITKQQKLAFDSLSKAYQDSTPYDYAFFGMRCGAAGYDVLSQLQILPDYSYTRTYWTIFYPKKLRKRLLAQATKNGWKVAKQEGTKRRKWERD